MRKFELDEELCEIFIEMFNFFENLRNKVEFTKNATEYTCEGCIHETPITYIGSYLGLPIHKCEVYLMEKLGIDMSILECKKS